MTVLGIASTLVATYFILHCIVIHSLSILTTEIELKSAAGLEAFLLLFLFFCVWVGGIDDEVVVGNHHLYSPKSFLSLMFVILATFLFILLISVPIYLTGGAIESSFSSMLIAMAGLAVLVSSSWYIRSVIVALCVGIYIYCAFRYLKIHVNWVNGHRLLHISSVLLSLGITLFLSGSGEFLIFRRAKTSEVTDPRTAEARTAEARAADAGTEEPTS